MAAVQIAEDGIHFKKDGFPFFYLADTTWSAFTNITEQEWIEYLKKRKQQGFNTLQINILPQWDRCWVESEYYPFVVNEDGCFQYEKGFCEEYFLHAQSYLEKAVAMGFVPALVVMWSNYVPGTWASKSNPHNIFPKTLLDEYCKKVVDTFDKFEPIYIISGDTDLETIEAIEYYKIVFQELKKLSPNSLKTLHIKGRYTYIPKELAEEIDFYMYQSGHNCGYPEKAYTMAEEFRKKYPKKPLLNGEPCYEQISSSGGFYRRFDVYDIRRAAWSSILSGADAGLTYGAHGVWNWQKENMPFNPNVGEGFDEAKTWDEALNFPGAWEYGYIGTILRELKIYGLYPDFRLDTKYQEIKMATTEDGKKSLIYVPYNTKVHVKENLKDAKIYTMELSSKNIGYPDVSVENEESTIGICSFQKDILIVIQR